MSASIALNRSTQLFGENSYVHNDISISDFLKNDNIPYGQRMLIHFVMLYNLPGNLAKKPEDRIYISNPGIFRALGCDVKNYTSPFYVEHLSAIQSALERYERDSDCFFRREFQNSEGKWIPLYLTAADGSKTFNEETKGLTKRRIILNVKRVKELLTALPDHVKAIKVDARSRGRKVIKMRPITLFDYLINDFIKTNVKDIQSKKNINHYLEDQKELYGDFRLSAIDVITPELNASFDVARTYLFTVNPGIANELITVTRGRPE